MVGDGLAPVEVPDVAGMGLTEAQATLDRAGLAVGNQREIPSNTAPEGVVIEQQLPAGTAVEPGTAVDLGISSGPQQAAPATASSAATATAPADAAEDGGDNSGPGGGGNSGPGGGGGD